MKVLFLILVLIAGLVLMFVNGCTINLQIENQYLGESSGESIYQGEISEEKTKASADIDADLSP